MNTMIFTLTPYMLRKIVASSLPKRQQRPERQEALIKTSCIYQHGTALYHATDTLILCQVASWPGTIYLSHPNKINTAYTSMSLDAPLISDAASGDPFYTFREYVHL